MAFVVLKESTWASASMGQKLMREIAGVELECGFMVVLHTVAKKETTASMVENRTSPNFENPIEQSIKMRKLSKLAIRLTNSEEKIRRLTGKLKKLLL